MLVTNRIHVYAVCSCPLLLVSIGTVATQRAPASCCHGDERWPHVAKRREYVPPHLHSEARASEVRSSLVKSREFHLIRSLPTGARLRGRIQLLRPSSLTWPLCTIESFHYQIPAEAPVKLGFLDKSHFCPHKLSDVSLQPRACQLRHLKGCTRRITFFLLHVSFFS